MIKKIWNRSALLALVLAAGLMMWGCSGTPLDTSGDGNGGDEGVDSGGGDDSGGGNGGGDGDGGADGDDIDDGGGNQDIGDDDASNGGTDGAPDEASLSGKSWEETEDGSVLLIARYFATGYEELYPPEIVVYAADSTSYLLIDLYADLFNPAYEASYWTDTYPFGGDDTVGYGRLLYVDDELEVNCTAAAGGVTVSTLGEEGEPIAATISVTEWEEFSSSGCEAVEVTGGFSIARNSDNSFGNDGSSTDEFIVNRSGGSISPAEQTFEENAETRYDPYMTADISFENTTLIHMSGNLTAEPSYYVKYEHYINIELAGELATGSYQVEEFTELGYSRFRETHYTGEGIKYRFCVAKEGTIVVSQIGGVGEQITGTYEITEVEEISGLTGCPMSYSGSFTVTVEDYSALSTGGGGTE